MQDRRNVNKRELKGYRRVLRNNLTPAEAALWKCLKAGGLNGTKWRRQFSVGSYILDFYCPEIKLAIELDGEVHNGQELHDEQRSYYLSKVAQIVVMRFENHLVFEHPEVILDSIKEYSRQVK